MKPIAIKLQRLPHGRGLELPAYASAHAAGLDLRAAVGEEPRISIAPGERMVVPTGLIVALPEGFEGQVRPRSGLALRHGVTCLNSPGTIDSDYRGEIMVLLINHGPEAFPIRRGDRIAQLVIGPVTQVRIDEVDGGLPGTARGAGGFGSSGVG